jgi:hypothetical protein
LLSFGLSYAFRSLELDKVTEKPFILKNGREAQYSGKVDSLGRPHGIGERVIISGQHKGQVNTGMFARGVLEGVGRRVIPNLETSTGVFTEGCLEGVGICEWPEGRLYAGQWKGHKIDGFGSCVSNDGAKFIGWWVNGKRHGPGLFVDSDGSKLARTFDYSRQVSQTSGLNNYACRFS